MSAELGDKSLTEEKEPSNCMPNQSYKKDTEIEIIEIINGFREGDITNLSKRLKHYRINYNKVCNENYNLKLEIKGLSNSVKANNKIINQKNQKLTTNAIVFNAYTEKITTLEKEKSDALTKVKDLNQEIRQLRQQMDDFQTNIKIINSENSELKLKVKEIKDSIKSKNKTIKNKNGQLAKNKISFNVYKQKITEKIEPLKQEFDNYKIKYNRISNDNYDLKLEILELKDLINSLNKSSDDNKQKLLTNAYIKEICTLEEEKADHLTPIGKLTEDPTKELLDKPNLNSMLRTQINTSTESMEKQESIINLLNTEKYDLNKSIAENLTKELSDKQNLNYMQSLRINALIESLKKQESVISLLNTEKHNLNKTITENKTEMEVISKEMTETKNKIKEITLEVEEYKTKYEEYISYNQKLTENNDKLRVDCEELKTTLDKFREKLKRMQNDSDKKAKAIANFIINTDRIKNNLLRDNSLLESEVKQLKTDLNDKNILCEKLESDLNSIEKEKEIFCQQMIDEKNQLRFECQKVVDTNKEENDKLLKRNSQLMDRIEAAKEAEIGIRKHEIERFKVIIQGKERQRIKDSKSNKKRETKLISKIKSLRNRLNHMKRECFSYRYKAIASKSIYSKAIEKLTKFSLQNTDQIFNEIIKVTDKMRENPNQIISDKTTETLNDIKTEFISLEESTKRISELRNDSRINCGLCSEDFENKCLLELHMKTVHSICFDEQVKEDSIY